MWFYFMNQLLYPSPSRPVKMDKNLTEGYFGELTRSWHESYVNFSNMQTYITTLQKFSPYEFIQKAVLCLAENVEGKGGRKALQKTQIDVYLNEEV